MKKPAMPIYWHCGLLGGASVKPFEGARLIKSYSSSVLSGMPILGE